MCTTQAMNDSGYKLAYKPQWFIGVMFTNLASYPPDTWSRLNSWIGARRVTAPEISASRASICSGAGRRRWSPFIVGT